MTYPTSTGASSGQVAFNSTKYCVPVSGERVLSAQNWKRDLTSVVSCCISPDKHLVTRINDPVLSFGCLAVRGVHVEPDLAT
jgi:hypothetical protein